MNALHFHSDSETTYYFPFVELRERATALSSAEEFSIPLPTELHGLTSPTEEETLAIVRFLAFRIARVLSNSAWPDGLRWYESYYEQTTFADYLEAATALLAALNLKIESTSDSGEISVLLKPSIEDLKDLFLEKLIPKMHHFRIFNPDEEGDFEDNSDYISVNESELQNLYSLNFFLESNRLIDLEPIYQMIETDDLAKPVAVRRSGVSTLQPDRDFSSPLDRVLITVLTVIKFFQNSSEIDESNDEFTYEERSIEELRQDMLDYIEEFPDEVEVAEEIFHESAHGVVAGLAFLTEAAVLNELGIISISDAGDEFISATLLQDTDDLSYLRQLGFPTNSDDDEICDPFVFDEPIGIVHLGWYEQFFVAS